MQFLVEVIMILTVAFNVFLLKVIGPLGQSDIDHKRWVKGHAKFRI